MLIKIHVSCNYRYSISNKLLWKKQIDPYLVKNGDLPMISDGFSEISIWSKGLMIRVWVRIWDRVRVIVRVIVTVRVRVRVRLRDRDLGTSESARRRCVICPEETYAEKWSPFWFFSGRVPIGLPVESQTLAIIAQDASRPMISFFTQCAHFQASFPRRF